MQGEVEYGRLPFYLHAFDVCIVPFKITPLTLATNPVKVYEYLSAGKPVVSVDLPELKCFGDLVQCASSPEMFVGAVREILTDRQSDSQIETRRQFAANQTWAHRVAALTERIQATEVPLVSVVLVTYNNLALTKQSLESLNAPTTLYPRYEVIVVDNASTDGTVAFLEKWQEGRSDTRILLNADNRGFAAGNNQGLSVARGEYFVLLNNDTVVTSGWLGTLVRHLQRDPTIGLIGPVTNNIGNEARIDIAYSDLQTMHAEARRWTLAHMGETHT